MKPPLWYTVSQLRIWLIGEWHPMYGRLYLSKRSPGYIAARAWRKVRHGI